MPPRYWYSPGSGRHRTYAGKCIRGARNATGLASPLLDGDVAAGIAVPGVREPRRHPRAQKRPHKERPDEEDRSPGNPAHAPGRELTRLHGGAIDGHAAPPGRATERLARRAACHPVRPWQGRVMTGQKDARPGNHTRSGQRTVNPLGSIPARQAERNPSWY